MNVDDIATRIKQLLDKVCTDAKGEPWEEKSKPWTVRIMSDMSSLAEQNGFEALYSKAPLSEWLYDMVWCKRENDHLNKVPLVLESEWSRIKREIYEDFDKLLLARTQLRVMIFYQDKTASVKNVLDELVRRIRSFQETRSGDCYLLAGLSAEDNLFYYREPVLDVEIADYH